MSYVARLTLQNYDSVKLESQSESLNHRPQHSHEETRILAGTVSARHGRCSAICAPMRATGFDFKRIQF
jgi:hypothetical protein